MTGREHDGNLNLRVPADVLRRLDALAERLKAEGYGALGSLKRSAVARLALARGLDVLEGSGGTSGRPGRRPRR